MGIQIKQQLDWGIKTGTTIKGTRTRLLGSRPGHAPKMEIHGYQEKNRPEKTGAGNPKKNNSPTAEKRDT